MNEMEVTVSGYLSNTRRWREVVLVHCTSANKKRVVFSTACVCACACL